MIDKEIEKNRYNSFAQNALNNDELFSKNNLTLPLKTPYYFYRDVIQSNVSSDSLILEIGSGMGENTKFILATGARVVATDISQHSLSVMEKRFDAKRLVVKVADMENLPFSDEEFDIVTSAGSLSYGDNDIVMNEIYRVLKSGGKFIAVDSLNNNLIYRFNRYIHYLRGKRSLSVINRTPDLKLLFGYKSKFGMGKFWFFGSLSYLSPLLNVFFGERKVKKALDTFDKIIKVKKSAFKFVMLVIKK